MSAAFASGREAMQWKKAEHDFADCFLCAHRCHIAPGKRGLCGVRENRGGTLFSLVYDRIVSAHVDPIEKKPLYHFLPGSRSYSIATVGCNFRCRFCQNWEISQAREAFAHGERVTPEQIVAAALATQCASISYTYTEPTVFFELAYDTAGLARERGLRNVFVTNGYQTPETVEKMAGRIDAANVDLKAFSEDFYRRMCKASLAPVLDSIREMHRRGIFVEVTTLVIPGENDSEAELRGAARFIASVSPDIPWHVSRFHPDYELTDRPVTPAATIYRALEIGKEEGLRYLYAGNLPGDEYENTHCPRCGKVVIARRGYFVSEVNLKAGTCAACGEKLPVIT